MAGPPGTEPATYELPFLERVEKLKKLAEEIAPTTISWETLEQTYGLKFSDDERIRLRRVLPNWIEAGFYGITITKPSGHTEKLTEVLEAINKDVKDEWNAMEHYRKLAGILKQQGPEFFDIATDLEWIASEEANHYSRLIYLSSVLEKRLKQRGL